MSLQKLAELQISYKTESQSKKKETMLESLHLLGKMFNHTFSKVDVNSFGEYVIYNEIKSDSGTRTLYKPFSFELSKVFVSVEIRTSNPTARTFDLDHFHMACGGFVRIMHFEVVRMIDLLIEKQ